MATLCKGQYIELVHLELQVKEKKVKFNIANSSSHKSPIKLLIDEVPGYTLKNLYKLINFSESDFLLQIC